MRFLLLALAFVFGTALGVDEPTCKDAHPSALEVFQVLPYEQGVACLYTVTASDEYITISFFETSNGHYNAISSNDSLIALEDMQSTPPHLDATGEDRFQITHTFPRDIYVIELAKHESTLSVAGAYKSIVLNEVGTQEMPQTITFSIKPSELEKLSFETLTQKQAFNAAALMLASSDVGSSATITSDKAVLFNGPSKDARSKAYLIKGDIVTLLQFKDNWLKIKYITRKGSSIEKWIGLAEIL